MNDNMSAPHAANYLKEQLLVVM